MSPFGSQAMLQGFFKPSATVTTLNCSPAGPGGCAQVEVETVSVAAAASTAAPRIDARYFEVAFMDVPLVERPRASSKKDSAYRAADRSCLPERASALILARRRRRKRLKRAEKSR